MLRKLLALVSKSCAVDNPDSPQHQEVLLPGTLYGMIIKEKLEEAMIQIIRNANLELNGVNKAKVDFHDSAFILPYPRLCTHQSCREVHQEDHFAF